MRQMIRRASPAEQGLYNPAKEHDSCGIGFVADIKNRKSHAIIQQGLQILSNLRHRGAAGADMLAGDGAGILIQMPDRLMREEASALGIDLPAAGAYAAGIVFLPRDDEARAKVAAAFERVVPDEGQRLLGWRDVPTDNSVLGYSVKPIEPVIRQVFIASNCADADAFERKLFVIRKRVHHAIWDEPSAAAEHFYIVSLSSRVMNYKGMILAENLPRYYPDLCDARTESALALVHQRFSTNTFPSWKLAQPFRFLCHNGEINTLRGNINWMLARRHSMKSDLLGDDLEKLWPLIGDGASDSATFDNALELLVAGGYSLPHAMMMMIPEAWDANPLMDEKRRAFYEYHAAMMEPWDGPAAVAFTDGRQIGATLDRNGLRPARYVITSDDLVVMASEVGVLPIPEEKIVKKWRLQPGKMLLVDRARCSSSTWSRAGSSTTRSSRRSWLRTSHTSRGSTTRKSASKIFRLRSGPCRRTRGHCSIVSRRSATRRRISASSSHRWARPEKIRSVRWGATSRLRCFPTGRRCCRTISSSASHR